MTNRTASKSKNLLAHCRSRMNRKPWVLALAIASHALLSGCGSSLPFVPFPSGITPPRTVAVMPLKNQTDQESGASSLRKKMNRNLKRKGYVAMPLSEVDEILSDRLAISSAEEVTRSRIPAIGSALGTDAIISGTLHRLGTSGSLRDTVEATIVLHDARTGGVLWQYHNLTSQPTSLSLERLSGGLTELLLGAPYSALVNKYLEQLLTEMPNGADAQQREER